MADRFAHVSQGMTGAATEAVAVTPHDDNDLAQTSRALWIGAGGTLSLILAGDSSAVTFAGVTAGTLLPFRVKRVLATGTTASAIVAVV